MSHFSVAVITDNDPMVDVKELERVLLPFHEYECTGILEYTVDVDITPEALEEYESRPEKYKDYTLPKFLEGWYGYPIAVPGGKNSSDSRIEIDPGNGSLKVYRRTNPNKKWDWWVIGGRFNQSIPMEHGVMTDSTKVKLLDLTGVRETARQQANELWEKFEQLTAGLELPKPWVEFWHERDGKDNKPSEATREAFNEHPAVKVLQENREALAIGFMECPVKAFANGKEAYVQDTIDQAFLPFALLVDGQWFERGGMGWWGMVSNEKDTKSWGAIFREQLAKVDCERFITIVDCQI